VPPARLGGNGRFRGDVAVAEILGKRPGDELSTFSAIGAP